MNRGYGSDRTLVAILLLLAIWAGLLLPVAARADERVALVVGNSDYKNVTRLKNPASDARLVAAALNSVGFRAVTLVENATQASLQTALRDFAEQTASADVAVIYYAGHGVEVDHVNYLIPVDAKITSDVDLPFSSVSLDTLVGALHPRRMSLIIVDACRDDPFKQMRSTGLTRSVSRGLAEPPETALDTMVVYSARAGTVARDGDGANSPFAEALSRRIAIPGVELDLMLRQVRDDVMSATKRQQQPFTYGSLGGDPFYFLPPAPKATTGAAEHEQGATAASLEAQLWANAITMNSVAAYRGYIATFPSGAHAEEAARDLAQLVGSTSNRKFGDLNSTPANDTPSTEGGLSARSTRIARVLGPFGQGRLHVYPDLPDDMLKKAQAWATARCGSQIIAILDQSLLGNGSGDATVFCENDLMVHKKGLTETTFHYPYAYLGKYLPTTPNTFEVRYGHAVLSALFLPGASNHARAFTGIMRLVLGAVREAER